MDYLIHFDIASFVLILVIYIANKLSKRFPSRTNRIFDRFLFVSILSAIFNILCVFIDKYVPVDYIWINNVLAVFHISFVNILPLLYYTFIISITHDQIHFKLNHHLTLLIPTVYEFFAISTSPFTHFVMYYDKEGVYHHGIGMTTLYIIAFVFIILGLYKMLFYRSKISRSSFFLVAGYSFLIILATIIQYFNPHILIIGYSIAIAIFLIYISLQNPADFIDQNRGVYNIKALKEYHFSTPAFKHACSFGLIYISNFENIKQSFGLQNSFLILRRDLEIMKKTLAIDYIFYIYDNCFLILDKNAQTIREKLISLNQLNLQKESISFMNGDTSHVHLKTETFVMENFDIETLRTSSYELISPMDKLIQILLFAVSSENKQKDQNGLIQIDESVVKKYEELQKITAYVNRAIATNSFEVHLQPIYDLHSKKFTSAESLIRLRDNDGNYISPAVFIPIAEENGRIFEIGDISIKKTCEFIKMGHLTELGISKININLSMNQCMQENIVEHLCSILDEYQIDKNIIRFEVTETIMAKSSEYFGTVINSMKERGVDFVVDDYGTGYSNTSRLLSYPFTEIKFDKSLVDAASESQKNADSLKYLIAMIKNSGQIVLAEGVESKEMSELLESYGCDLIQGYYYSKPLPLEKFVEIVKQVNK